MRTQRTFLPVTASVAFLLFISSCNENSRNSARKDIYAANDESAKEPAPTPSQTDETKMEREAQLRFRVKEVEKATGKLEKMAVLHGGYVAKSFMDIDESETLIKNISTDSAQEIKKLQQRNHLEVFVLNSKLNSFLDSLKPLVDYMEFRHITAYDVAMEEAHTTTENGQGATVTYKDQQLVEEEKTANVKTNGSYAFTPSTNSLRSTPPKALKTRFARVTMDIYQTPVIKKWIIPNPDSFEVARGGFWDDFVSSLKTGWRGTVRFFNVLVSFWPLLLLLGLAWSIWRRRKGLPFMPVLLRISRKKNTTA